MAGVETLSGGNIEPRGLVEEMRSSYLDYAMSVIVGRALPDVRDGLKPVHRRVLYSMHESGLQPNRPYRKCANVVGGVMGNFHPHGDSSIYDTLVRLAQDFAMREPLVDGQGNFGSIDNDPAAAMRYTEARLARLATEMLRDIDADTVDFTANYDDTRLEPTILPSRFPNLLVNGSAGIAVGMATNIPPHNLAETIDATVAYIDNPQIDVAGLMQHIKGPDFPTGGTILGWQGIKDAYETGRGRVVDAGQGAHRADPPGQGGDHRHRDALPGVQGRRAQRRLGADQEDRRGREQRPREGRLRPARRVGQVGRPAGDRAQARRDPQGRAEQPVQVHAAAEHVRREHRRAGGRRAAHALAARGHRRVRAAPARGGGAPHQARAAPARGAAAHPRGPADRDRGHRRGDRADPRARATPTPPATA